MAETTNYELMVIIDSGIGQASIDKRLESIRKQINKNGKIYFEDIWGDKDLGYAMNGHDRGFYAVLDFSLNGEAVKELESYLRFESEVIRHLIVKLPLKYEPRSKEDIEEAHRKEKEKEELEAEKKAA